MKKDTQHTQKVVIRFLNKKKVGLCSRPFLSLYRKKFSELVVHHHKRIAHRQIHQHHRLGIIQDIVDDELARRKQSGGFLLFQNSRFLLHRQFCLVKYLYVTQFHPFYFTNERESQQNFATFR